jgi:hypothetical protein
LFAATDHIGTNSRLVSGGDPSARRPREAIASGDRDQVHGLAGGGPVPLLLAISNNSPQMRPVTASGPSTIPSGCTPRSATSPQMTSTKAARRSATSNSCPAAVSSPAFDLTLQDVAARG